MSDSSPPRPSLARRFGALTGDAGWRVALHVLPYAVTAAVATEAAILLRASFVWKLPLLLVAFASLHVAVLLGAHVAAFRIATEPAASARHHLRVAGLLTAESFTILAVVTVAALAAVGLLDLGVSATAPRPGAQWPGALMRGIATLSALAILALLLAAGIAAAAAIGGRRTRLIEGLGRLAARPQAGMGVILAVIIGGTIATVAIALIARWSGVWPPAAGAALAKAAGYLVVIVATSVGAALLAGED
ncbi:hypothetical protein [Phreatobacter sp.]|uniref:hypothetical protein n=1 Tax=Phreatobacter sp. TaxID=1966341 RepID=UPI003F6EF9CB